VHCKRCGAHIGWAFEHKAVERCGDIDDDNVGKLLGEEEEDDDDDDQEEEEEDAEDEDEEEVEIAAVDDFDFSTLETASKSEEQLLAELPSCITLEKGWWSYKWCHKKEIRQFHTEADGTLGQDWSLGKFDTSGKKFRAGGAASKTTGKQNAFYSQFFIGGQKCDETGGGRSTEVKFYCCDDNKGTYIQGITEPATCKYSLKICAPSLCKASAPPGYSSTYPPCGSCGKRFRRAGMTMLERKKACKTACPVVPKRAQKTKKPMKAQKTSTKKTKAMHRGKKESSKTTKKSTKKTAAGKGGGTGGAKAKTVVRTEEELLKGFQSNCMLLEKGWWSYKWCHKKEIRQFHKEPDGKVAAEWSLGKYHHTSNPSKDRSDVERQQSKASKDGAFYSHYFNQGQQCEETKALRQTEVRFFCCDDGKGSYIQSITEPATCQYTLKICAPELCSESAPSEYSSTYPPCGKCKKRFKRADMTAQQWMVACKTACKGQATTPASIQARRVCEVNAAKDGTLLRFFGFLWPAVVMEDSADLSWADSMGAVTALGVR
jgi:hypothetical protein